jgi:pimeloyl-ACP methyl ester carboxylesterase
MRLEVRGWLALIAVLLIAASGAQAGEPPRHNYFTASDGVKIHYMTVGNRGSWVVLIHGYTDDAERMWFRTGIAATLARNHRVVALDNRNHGLSDKPEPYGFGRAEDVIELMSHLGIDKAHIHGYSMGGSIVARMMSRYPERFITAAFGGSGISESDDSMRAAAAALDPPMPEPQGEEAAAFKALRDSSASRTAAAARAAPGTATAPRPPLEINLKSIDFPVLAINGEYDRPYSKTHRMWRELRQFQSVIVPKKNHMSMIMIGGPMPPEYIKALKKFIDANDIR